MFFLIDNLNELIMYLNTSGGILVFFFIYIVSVIFLLPGSWLSLLSGFLYGSIVGSLVVFVSAFCGACLSFLISKYFFAESINNIVSKYSGYPLLQEILKKGGLKLIILSRLSPIFPFSILNYFYGLNNISFKDFGLSLFFILPGTYVYCSLGNLANELSDIRNISAKENLPFTLIGFAATVFVFYLIVKYANDFLRDSKNI